MFWKSQNSTLKVILLGFFLIATVACEKEGFDNVKDFEKITLPTYTESGQRVMGCLINNTPWTIFGKHEERGLLGHSYWKENDMEVEYNFYQDTITFNARGRMTKVKNDKYISDTHLSFGFKTNMKVPGNHFLDSSYPGNMIYRDNNRTEYISIDENPVVLSIKKFSGQEGIVSGTFVGYLYNRDNRNDSILISQGVFDVKIPTF